MARRRCLLASINAAASSTRKRSLASRAEVRELILPESLPGGIPPTVELARALRVKNADESMLRLAEVMERSTGLFRNSPDFAIPEVRYSQIEDGRFPYYVTRQVNRRGVLVVRGAVAADTSLRWRDELAEYLEVNGLDSKAPGVRNVYWSKAQVQAREDLRIRHLLSALNRLWKPDAKSAVDLSKSLSYCDKAFVGAPACSGNLPRKAGVMAGGPWACQRWVNPHHQQAYREIFEGRWEDWDPFKAGPRVRAAEAAGLSTLEDVSAPAAARDPTGGLGSGAVPQAFRPFQGYLSLGRWGELGNVHVVPMMRVATAYMLLRPFASDIFGSDVIPGDEDWLCGAGDGPELALSPKWHQPIMDAMVRLPPLSPGDAVFWHTDIIHCEASAMSRTAAIAERANVAAIAEARGQSAEEARDKGCGAGRGDDDGAGRFDPDHFAGIHLSSLPICEANSAYVKGQAAAFLQGVAPPVFARTTAPPSRMRSDGDVLGESQFVGRATCEDLSRGGEQAMGVRNYLREHSNAALERHHQLLGLPYQW